MSNKHVENMITLKSNDGEEFIATEAEAKVSKTISHLIEDGCAQNAIPLANVDAKILAKVLEYCKMHVSNTERGELRTASSESQIAQDMEEWETEFVKVDQETMFNLILAANYLAIQGLLDLLCKTVAGKFNGKTPEEIRAHFHIVNDYTTEEEAQIRQELSWAFD